MSWPGRVKRRGATRRPLALLAVTVLSLGLVGCSDGTGQAMCPRPDHTVARAWNEAALEAIRRDFPAPTVHARNLFHLSAAMWDTWAFFEPDATPYLIDPSTGAPSPDAHRDEAIAFAAHTILSDRYSIAVGADESLAHFDNLLADLCLDPSRATTEGSPAALGVSIANEVLAATIDDGSVQQGLYVAPFTVVNDPLVIDEPGTPMQDPNRWQQLHFRAAMTQNGQLLESNVQDYVGPHWGSVQPFALDPTAAPLPIDPGPPPLHGTSSDDLFKAAAVEVVGASSRLDPSDGEQIDISPTALGNNPLGTNDGTGHPTNPATGQTYEPNVVLAADYFRAIAEFWADGPMSETPPGHWNTIANQVSDALDDHRIEGAGPSVSRLEWDLSLYFALNAALHDAAIAAWGAKAHYDYSRPISMIRYLASEGTLPLEADLVEVITAESSAAGERHAHLAEHAGEIAIRSWAPEPVFFGEDLNPVRWIRAVEWVPYQRATFVTPAFPGYVSGHSTFSRAAAEVLKSITGSEFFPDGLAIHTVEELEFEDGPTKPVELQWATFFDAADEAGISRIYGGIHVEADDLAGRQMGSQIGRTAWEKAKLHLR